MWPLLRIGIYCNLRRLDVTNEGLNILEFVPPLIIIKIEAIKMWALHICLFTLCAGFVNSVSESLFTYRIYESWDIFRNPDFSPITELTNISVDPELERLCGGDQFCLFDVAATGRRDVGISTLENSRNVESIIQLSLPGLWMRECSMHVCITTVGMLVVTKHVFCIACAVVTSSAAVCWERLCWCYWRWPQIWQSLNLI